MTPQIETMRIPLLTSVHGGSAIPDDWQHWAIKQFRDVRVVESANQFDQFAAVEVDGDSLKGCGIYNGDILIFKITCNYRDECLGIWQTPTGRTAKYAYEDVDGTIKLHNKNGWSQNWQPDEISLLGIVVRIERDI